MDYLLFEEKLIEDGICMFIFICVHHLRLVIVVDVAVVVVVVVVIVVVVIFNSIH